MGSVVSGITKEQIREIYTHIAHYKANSRFYFEKGEVVFYDFFFKIKWRLRENGSWIIG